MKESIQPSSTDSVNIKLSQRLVSRELVELCILEEEPYNWKKHFLFQLPEVMSFGLKVGLALVLFQFATVAIISSVLSIVLDKDVTSEVFTSGIKEIKSNINQSYAGNSNKQNGD